MNYSHIDITSYSWSDYVRRDYVNAMEWLKEQGFENCLWLDNVFQVCFKGVLITIEISESSVLGMVCSLGTLTGPAVFGDIKVQIATLKLMAKASNWELVSD